MKVTVAKLPYCQPPTRQIIKQHIKNHSKVTYNEQLLNNTIDFVGWAIDNDATIEIEDCPTVKGAVARAEVNDNITLIHCVSIAKFKIMKDCDMLDVVGVSHKMDYKIKRQFYGLK